MMLYLRIGPVKHRLLFPNYHPLSKVMFLIIRFFLFAGKDDLLFSIVIQPAIQDKSFLLYQSHHCWFDCESRP